MVFGIPCSSFSLPWIRRARSPNKVSATLINWAARRNTVRTYFRTVGSRMWNASLAPVISARRLRLRIKWFDISADITLGIPSQVIVGRAARCALTPLFLMASPAARNQGQHWKNGNRKSFFCWLFSKRISLLFARFHCFDWCARAHPWGADSSGSYHSKR